MSFFNTLTFCAVTAISVTAYFGLSQFLNRRLLLILLSSFWTVFFFKIPVQVLLVFFAFCIAFYFVATTSKLKKWRRVTFSLALATAFWALAKLPSVFTALRAVPLIKAHVYILPLVGVPYSFCRLFSFVVDYKNGQIRNPHLSTFLAYMFYFPTLLSGPVTNYRHFQGIEKAPSKFDINEYVEKYLVPGIKRIVLGMVKKNLIAELLSSVALPFISIDTSSNGRVVLAAYAYCIYVYLDFSGYTDLAVGLSKILKIEIPENFNNPFKARNPQDFWSRWHISLSKWLYEYIFAPVYAFLLRNFPEKMRLFLPGIAIFVTFAFSGVWHGDESRFVREGLYHATALFIFVNFDMVMKKYRPATRRWMRESPVVTGISTFITFHYIVVSFMFFSLNFQALLKLGRRLVGGVI